MTLDKVLVPVLDGHPGVFDREWPLRVADIDRYGRSAAPAHLDLVRRVAARLPAGMGLWLCAAAYCDAREAYYRRLALTRPNLGVFLKGWLNRLNALRGETGFVTLKSAQAIDFGDTGYVAKVPDLGEDPDYDI